jgi:hypothetical protein
MDRFALGVDRDDAGGVRALTHGPARYLRDATTLRADAAPPAGADLVTGTYRGWNPWAPGFRVFLRAGKLVIAWPSHEAALTPLEDEDGFRVGDERSADRVRFETMVGGVAQHAIYNAVLYVRSFMD